MTTTYTSDVKPETLDTAEGGARAVLERAQDATIFREAGYEERHISGVILAIAVKTLSNYCNHIFKPEVDSAFADYKV